MKLPKDPFMLLSYINTQLRDNYPSLKELSKSCDISETDIKKSLANVGYTYDSASNRFIRN